MIENFGWLIEGEVAGSGGLIHHEELGWLREQVARRPDFPDVFIGALRASRQ